MTIDTPTIDDLLGVIGEWEARFAAAGCAPEDRRRTGIGWQRPRAESRRLHIADLCCRGLLAAMHEDLIGYVVRLPDCPIWLDVPATMEACWSYDGRTSMLPSPALWREALREFQEAGVSLTWGLITEAMLLPVVGDRPEDFDPDGPQERLRPASG